MRSFECLRVGKGRRGECLGTAYKERQEERGGGRAIGREQEGRRRRGCPVMLKPGAFEKEEGKDTGRKRGEKERRELCKPPRLHYHVNLKRERDREGETGQPGPSSGAGSIWCCRLWNE